MQRALLRPGWRQRERLPGCNAGPASLAGASPTVVSVPDFDSANVRVFDMGEFNRPIAEHLVPQPDRVRVTVVPHLIDGVLLAVRSEDLPVAGNYRARRFVSHGGFSFIF